MLASDKDLNAEAAVSAYPKDHAGGKYYTPSEYLYQDMQPENRVLEHVS